MAPKQFNYISPRLVVIQEGSNILHKVSFLSKAPYLSIILSFSIKIMLTTEEHRTMVTSFCVHTQDRSFWIFPQRNNFPHLTIILALQIDISIHQLINVFLKITLHLSHTYQCIKQIMMCAMIRDSQKDKGTGPNLSLQPFVGGFIVFNDYSILIS